jgi:hypothetical protein
LTAEAASVQEVRVRSPNRQVIQGKHIVIGFGDRVTRVVANILDQSKPN